MNDQIKELSGALNAYDSAPEGTQFPVLSTHVDQARQNHYHQATDVRAEATGAAFGTIADATIFAQDISCVIANAGLPNDGRVLVRQRIFQTGRVRLDEVLTVEAEVQPFGESARGRHLHCNTAFRRADQTVPLRMATEHLLPFATPPEKSPSNSDRSDPVAGMDVVGGLRLNPDKVAGFAKEVGNKIHSDPAFAQSRGFRAPIAQGLMQLTALHGVIVTHAMPWEMDLDTRFMRPVFWDGELTLYADPDRRCYRCIDQDGKLTAEAVLHHLATEDMEP